MSEYFNTYMKSQFFLRCSLVYHSYRIEVTLIHNSTANWSTFLNSSTKFWHCRSLIFPMQLLIIYYDSTKSLCVPIRVPSLMNGKFSSFGGNVTEDFLFPEPWLPVASQSLSPLDRKIQILSSSRSYDLDVSYTV